MGEYIRKLMGDEFYNTIFCKYYRDVKIGSSGYLDSFNKDDFEGHSIMMGHDLYRRWFCAFRVSMTDGDEEYCYIYTIFQRFSDNPTKYVLTKSHFSESKTYHFERLFNSGSANINDEGYRVLERIFADYANGNRGTKHIVSDFDGVETEYTVRLHND